MKVLPKLFDHSDKNVREEVSNIMQQLASQQTLVLPWSRMDNASDWPVFFKHYNPPPPNAFCPECTCIAVDEREVFKVVPIFQDV